LHYITVGSQLTKLQISEHVISQPNERAAKSCPH